MFTRPFDTTPEAWAAQRQALARMDPEARVRVALDLSDSVRAIQIEGLCARNPAWTECDAVRHVVASQVGVDLPERP